MLGRSPGAPGGPQRRDGLLVLCRILNVITAICELLCIAAFAMAIYVRANAPVKDLFYMSGQAVRVFGIVWAAGLILIETEWRFLLKLAPLLELWFARGIAQIFIACLTYREAYSQTESESDFHKSLQLYRTLASAALLTCGFIYIFGGVLCLGAIKRMHARREENLMAAEVEVEELERRRRELNRLLGRRDP